MSDTVTHDLFVQHLQMEFNMESYLFMVACDRIKDDYSVDGWAMAPLTEVKTIYDQVTNTHRSFSLSLVDDNIACRPSSAILTYESPNNTARIVPQNGLSFRGQRVVR